MNWKDVLPTSGMALQQRAWERGRALLRCRAACPNMTFREMGKRIGVSTEHARQLLWKAERNRDKTSPVERYLRQDRDIWELAEKIKRREARKS